MLSKLIFVACVLCAHVLPAHAALEPDAPASLSPSAGSTLLSGSITEQIRTAPARRGTLYRVTQGSQTGYLFGTIHIGKPEFLPLDPAVMQALGTASSLVLELDTRKSVAFYAALNKHGLYPVGDSIRQHLTPAAYQRLVQVLTAAGVDPVPLARYKPWLIANLLIGRALERRGYLSSNGVESFLLAPAQLQTKQVVELESADVQLALFDSLNDADEETYMLENLANLINGSAIRQTEGMIDAWTHSDDSKLDSLLTEMTTGDTVSSQFMQHTLLGLRNQQMAANIDTIMQRDRVAFVGVGMLHLAGENGLPQLLRQRGYVVEKMY